MPIEISVGPPVLTINQGGIFMVTDENAEISSNSELGVYASDTRFLSSYKIYANGQPWQRLSSATVTYFSSLCYLTNNQFESRNGTVPADVLSLTISREVGKGICEQLDVSNYGKKRVQFSLEIAMRSDFADIFDVRAHRFVRRGNIVTVWDPELLQLRTSYSNDDFCRHFVYRLLSCGSPAHFANGRVVFDIDLEPGSSWHVASRFELVFGKELEQFDDLLVGDKTVLNELQSAWQARATKISSSNEEFYRFFTQSVDDMGALRLYERELSADSFTPAAGVPWYVALFGRDSLISGLQTMLVNNKFSLGTLKRLAEFQSLEIDDWRDAQPGKILHELRQGELAHFKQIPHTPYYGTADATPLYLILLHETWKWLGQKSIIETYRDVALRCLEWIDKYGDLDGDGFQEFKTQSTLGYENMCWKDSGDSVIYPDGTNVPQPKGLCELQGYVFDAWMRMAEVFDALGEPERSQDLRAKAAKLQKQFIEKFWCDDIEYFAYAIDPAKNPVKTITSNAGHLLWSGIAGREQAEKVGRRLMKNDMSSGWGIRTLSKFHPSYNPHSYHCGSVWPHDNGIIVLGLKRYGLTAEVGRVVRDLSEAASMFISHRIPELYAGIDREVGRFPVQYKGANVPQAWAAGSVFHMVQAILGLQPDAPNGALYIDPVLPRWLPDLKLSGLTVGEASIDLNFWREKDSTGWEAHVREGKINVIQKSWEPWDPTAASKSEKPTKVL